MIPAVPLLLFVPSEASFLILSSVFVRTVPFVAQMLSIIYYTTESVLSSKPHFGNFSILKPPQKIDSDGLRSLSNGDISGWKTPSIPLIMTIT